MPLDLVLKNLTTFAKGKNVQGGVNLRIWAIYYVLLIFRYISFSSHEKTQFVFWNQEKSGFLMIKLSLKIVLYTEQMDEEIVIN